MWWALVLALLPLVDPARVHLVNDGPAVLGAPIMFEARVKFHDEKPPDEVYYDWYDNATPQHTNTSEPTSSLDARLLLAFSSKDTPGYYTMTVRVMRSRAVLPDTEIGRQSSLFSITVNLNGGIELSQAGVPHRDPGHVSTVNETQLLVRFRDPHHFLDSATKIDYFWSVNDRRSLGPFQQPQLRYNFSMVGSNFVRVISVAHFSTNESVGVRDSSKWGQFTLNFIVDDPVTQVNVSGDNWLKHGELLNMTVSCNGTGPWNYCVSVYHGKYNVTGNETCSYPHQISECRVQIVRYLRDNGTHTLLTVLSNAVSRRVTPVAVTVYTPVRAPQLSYYIVPLSCALAALVFILFGSIRLIKARRDYNLEIADFDFSQADSRRQASFGRRLLASLWPGGARRAAGTSAAAAAGSGSGAAATETDTILPRGRTRRRSYGLVEGYEDD